MITLDSICDVLDKAINPWNPKDHNAWVMVYKGQRIGTASGKTMWERKGSATNARGHYKSTLVSKVKMTLGLPQPGSYWSKTLNLEPAKYSTRYMNKLIDAQVDKWVRANIKVVSLVEFISGQAQETQEEGIQG
jgi:hypothetical protein